MDTREVVDYIILDAEYSSTLTKQVQGYINIGWSPLGPAQCSISKSDYSTDKLFSQTLVKYKENGKKEVSLSYIKE